MCEITTHLGPLRLTWEIDYSVAGIEIVEVFATLVGISDDTFWQETKSEPQWCKNNRCDVNWWKLWEWIEETHWQSVAASDAAREAIERERNDLRREDGERFAEDRR